MIESENKMNLVIEENETGTYYCRSKSIKYQQLCEQMEKCYTNKRIALSAVITPSGMAAISVSLHVLLMDEIKNETVNIIRGSELYCDTPRLTKYLSNNYKFNEHIIDVNDTVKIIDLFDSHVKNQTNILLIESCTNPSGDIFDFTIIPQLRKKSKKLVVIVDNTWLTHVIFNPFDYDVDITVLSLTKYYSAGQCIAGAILAKRKLQTKFFDYIRINGLHVSPVHCDIIIRALNTIDNRMIKSSVVTTKVVEFLDATRKFVIRHPSLSGDISHKKANQFFKKYNSNPIYPAIISFTVPLKITEAIEWMKSTALKYETSYGSSYSKFDPWPKDNGESTTCRLAIGYEDSSENICSLFI